MKKIIISLSIVLSLQNLYAMDNKRDLPIDPVLPLKEQMSLFVRAYEPFNPAEIDLKKTNIPGLIPMIRMQYSYINHFIKEPDYQ